MGYEAVREALRRWGDTGRFLREQQQRIDGLLELRAGVYEAAGIGLSGGVGSGKGTHGDPTGRLAAGAQELIRCYDASIAQLQSLIAGALRLQQAVDEAIARLSQRQGEAIRRRYAGKQAWEIIAANMGISQRQAHRLEAKALARLSRDIEPL